MDKKKMQIRNPRQDEMMRILTDGTFSRWTGRKVPAFTKEQAAAYIGNIMHETGSKDLSNLDVVEVGSGAGRGAMQYTGPRREAYDRAMSTNPNRNSVKDQMRYAAEEYAGRHDKGGSLIGYTQSLESIPRDVRSATSHLLDQYFKPADPNASRKDRTQNAINVLKAYPNKPKAKSRPTPRSPWATFGSIFGFK